MALCPMIRGEPVLRMLGQYCHGLKDLGLIVNVSGGGSGHGTLQQAGPWLQGWS